MSLILPVSRRIRTTALTVLEPLEARAYLTGVVLGSAIDQVTTTPSPAAVAVADLNSDGKADLIVGQAPAGVGAITVFISNGNGTYSPVVYPIDATPAALATGHFHSGTAPDVVAGTDGTPGNITLFLNATNSGNFVPSAEVPALDDNSAIAVGDFNNDGDTDVLTISDSATSSNNAMLILGNGTGGLTAQAPFSLPFGSATAVAVADFNGDGNLDFAVTNEANNSVSVFLGNGNGTFQAGHTFATGPGPTSIAIGDFNGGTLTNGNPAIGIVTADSTGGEVSFLGNDGSGGFSAPTNTAIPASALNGGPVQVRTANFTGSATAQDLAVLLSSGSTSDAAVLLGNGNGTFRIGTTVSNGGGTAIATGDVNDDGLADLAIVSDSQISTFLNVTPASTTDQLAFNGEPASSASTGSLAPVTVDLEDPHGNLLSTDDSNITLTLSGGGSGAALGGTTTVAAVNGVATFSDLAIAVAGTNYVLTATDGSFTSAVSTPFNIGAASTSPLVPTLGAVSLSPTVVAGAKLNARVPVVITNSGGVIKGKVVVNVYADLGTTLDGNQVLAGTATKTVLLKTGKKQVITINIKSLPIALPVGTYHLITEITDPSGMSNVTAATTQTVQLAAPFIQPRAAVGAVTPAHIALNKSGSALVTITNNGNVAATGIVITLSLSTDGITPVAGIVLQSLQQRSAKILPNKSKAVRLRFKATAAIPAGSYYLYVSVSLGGIATSVVGTLPFTLA